MEEYIGIKSFWGMSRNEYITNGGDKLAVILPGHCYTNMAPLLYYPLNIALESGYDALAVEYGFQRGIVKFAPDEESLARLVDETKQAINECLEKRSYSEILFIGKSLGTFVQVRLKGEFSAYPQKHIFLTPLPECLDIIKRTHCMVIAGTKDKVFKDEHIAALRGLKNVTLKTAEGADHRLETGSYKEDLKVLTEVCGNVYGFINNIKH